MYLVSAAATIRGKTTLEGRRTSELKNLTVDNLSFSRSSGFGGDSAITRLNPEILIPAGTPGTGGPEFSSDGTSAAPCCDNGVDLLSKFRKSY